MAKPFIPDPDDVSASYPANVFIPWPVLDKSAGYPQITETFTWPGAANDYTIRLDYGILQQVAATILDTTTSTQLLPVRWTDSPGPNEVAVNFDRGLLRVHPTRATNGGSAQYRPIGTVVDAQFLMQLQREVAAAQMAIGGGGAVDSVNSKTGVVVLDHTDVGAAAASHTHAMGEVTGLSGALSNKLDTSAVGSANGAASLDAGGKVPSAQLPALALTDVHVVASEVAQLALTAQEGDIAIRSDQNKTYVHNGGTAGTMADWAELLTPGAPVISVNGKTGAVSINNTDVGAAAASHTHAQSEITGLSSALSAIWDDLDGRIPYTELGAAHGAASLDGTGRLPLAQLSTQVVRTDTTQTIAGAKTFSSDDIKFSRVAVGAGTGTPTYLAYYGYDLGSIGMAAGSSTLIIGGRGTPTAVDACLGVGQGNNNQLQFVWRSNATAANAYAELVTWGYNNPLRINTRELTLNTISNHPVTVGGASGAIGFFGKTPVARQSASDLTGVIAALKAYGLLAP